MDHDFEEGDQVTFRVGNEYMIGSFYHYASLNNDFCVIREGGKYWYAYKYDVYRTKDSLN